MDAIAWQLLSLELALVVLLAVLSAGEAAINIVRRPGMADELDERGRRGKRAGSIGRRAGYYLAAIQVAEFLITFTYAGIAAAFIAPRLSALLAFFLQIDTTAIFTDVSAVAVTVAVKVTDWTDVDGFTEEPSVAIVLALFTVWPPDKVPVPVLKPASPS